MSEVAAPLQLKRHTTCVSNGGRLVRIFDSIRVPELGGEIVWRDTHWAHYLCDGHAFELRCADASAFLVLTSSCILLPFDHPRSLRSEATPEEDAQYHISLGARI